MFTSTKIALAAALILGAASAALANDVETNPSEAQSAREWVRFLGQNQKHVGNAGTSFGFAGSRPRSGCDNRYSYDRANYSYSYDLVCDGINLSPH